MLGGFKSFVIVDSGFFKQTSAGVLVDPDHYILGGPEFFSPFAGFDRNYVTGNIYSS